MTVLMVGLMDVCENEIICCLTATNQQEAHVPKASALPEPPPASMLFRFRASRITTVSLPAEGT